MKAPDKFFFVITAICFMGISLTCSKPYKKEYKEAVPLRMNDDIPSLEKALKKYNKAIFYAILAMDGKYDTLKALGIKLIQAEMYLEAAKYLEEARALQPGQENIYYYLGLCYANYARITAHREEKERYISLAEKTYMSGLNVKENSPALLYAAGLLYGFIKNEPEKGIQFLSRAAAGDPRDVQTHFALGNLYYQTGNTGAALVHYQKILELAPKDTEQWLKAQENLELMRNNTSPIPVTR